MPALRCTTPLQLFAPGNWKCCSENESYQALVGHWLSAGYTLRYSGGMVPDVHNLLIKVRLLNCDVCTNPSSSALARNV